MIGLTPLISLYDKDTEMFLRQVSEGTHRTMTLCVANNLELLIPLWSSLESWDERRLPPYKVDEVLGTNPQLCAY